MNNIDKQYQALLNDILVNGVKKEDRTGTGTISVFGRQIRHKMSEGFPLLTTKKMPFKTIVTELLWFLRGDTNIKFLVDNGCNIWNGDAYKNYCKYTSANSSEWNKWMRDNGDGSLSMFTQEEFVEKIKTDDEFAKTWGELGPIYGKQWRQWDTITKKWWNDPEYQGYGSDRSGWEYYETRIDQIQNLINDLKTNPDSRRLMVNAWNTGEIESMVLPPCHYGFQVYTRELSFEERNELYVERCLANGDGLSGSAGANGLNYEYYEKLFVKYNIPKRAISLMFNMRSNDVPLGLPFNIASYGLLLEILANVVNMVPDELIGNLGDCHIYLNQIEGCIEQIGVPYTAEERHTMLKEAMGDEAYENAVEQLEAFGGGLSEYCDSYKIPQRTREPYVLPTLKIESEIKWAEGDCLPTYSISDFTIENYQSHPTIKVPLSN